MLSSTELNVTPIQRDQETREGRVSSLQEIEEVLQEHD